MNDEFGVLVVDAPEVMVVTVGEQGPPGRDGAGGDGGGGQYLEAPFLASSLVTINHNFGRRPQVQVLSSGSREVITGVTHLSVNQVQLDFVTPQSGRAILTA